MSVMFVNACSMHVSVSAPDGGLEHNIRVNP